MTCSAVVACALLASGCHLVFELDDGCPSAEVNAHDEDADCCGDTAQCSLGHFDGQGDTLYAAKSGSLRDQDSLDALAFEAGGILTFRAAFAPQVIDCEVTDQHGEVATVQHESEPILDAGELGFDLSYAILHVDYVAVYSIVE